VLNYHAFVSAPPDLAAARAAYCGTDVGAIKTQMSLLAEFNQSGDTGVFTPGMSATAPLSKAQADILFWDETYR
jgi:hypothetical protein